MIGCRFSDLHLTKGQCARLEKRTAAQQNEARREEACDDESEDDDERDDKGAPHGEFVVCITHIFFGAFAKGSCKCLEHIMRYVYYLIPSFVGVHYMVITCVREFSLECTALPVLLLGISYTIFGNVVYADPGIAPRTTVPEEKCRKCGRRRVEKVFHCPICNVCVKGFDHHCDVLDACIGEGNIVAFRAFLLYHAIMCLYGSILHLRLLRRHLRQPATIYLLAMLMVELVFSASFALFWVFHKGLAVCDMRTVDLIHRCRSWLRSEKADVARLDVTQRERSGKIAEKTQ